MEPARFASTVFGAPAREPGNRWALWYYKPEPLPRTLELAPATVMALSEADSSLGHLHGLGRLIKDPELLLGPYLTREAVASSRIEGTETSLSDVLQAEATEAPSSSEDVEEVKRYVAANRLAIDLVRSLPITQRLVNQVHARLLRGVRGTEKLPGEFRRTPVWVGSPTDSPDTAVYVPPIPADLGDLFTDWERFVNDPPRMPPLVQCALTHYQFETIHPYLDGNGRIGRLLIGLQLIQQARLTTPLLYISGYLEAHRREYYDRLQGVRERGEIQEWLQFFLTAVRRQADDGVHRAGRLVELRERYIEDAAATRSNLQGLVDIIFRNPYLTVSRVERRLALTNQGARNLIKDAERRGWLANLGPRGRGGRNYWYARDVFEVIEAPFEYARNQSVEVEISTQSTELGAGAIDRR
jgi:Fic family protein